MSSMSPRRMAYASSARSVTSVPERNPRWKRTGPRKRPRPHHPNPRRGASYGNGSRERGGRALARAERRTDDRHPSRAADHLHDHPADDAEGDRFAASGSDPAGGAGDGEPGPDRARDRSEHGALDQQGAGFEGPSRVA